MVSPAPTTAKNTPKITTPTNKASCFSSSISTTTSVITSDNFPANYPPSSNTVYRFDVPDSDRVLVTFTNFSIQFSFNCVLDALEVFYRYEESYKFLTKYCGTWDPFSVVILSSKGAFRMISDSSYESKGFRAEFSAIKEDYDKTVNNTEGKVSSPRYHGEYPNNADHYITILNQKGSRIVLQFLLFDVHSSDFLEIQNGIDPFSPTLVKLSGTKLPNTVYGYGKGIRLHFQSDLIFTQAGYLAKYKVEKVKECFETDTGADYSGTQSTAVSGATCMSWHNAGNSTELQRLPENFCRNPDGRPSPWCFTSQGVIEFCSIEKCREITENSTHKPLTTGTGIKVKSGDTGQTDGVTEANKVTGGTALKTIPVTIGGVSFFVAVMVLIAVAAKRRQTRNNQDESYERRPSGVHPVDEGASTSGETRYGRSKYHPSNILVPSEEITYTAIDAAVDQSEPCTGSISSFDTMDTTLRRFCDGKRLAIHFDEDGYGIVDEELKEDFNDNRFIRKKPRDGDYDHLRSFKVKWEKADEEVEALYDNCQAKVIRESKLSDVFDDTYDHTTTSILKNSLRESKDQSGPGSNVYHDCLSQVPEDS
uniref:Tolloid-like protein 1 n=1 Tax=Magallana gigas TaxID=29159 RepID=K1R2R5_MAGGI